MKDFIKDTINIVKIIGLAVAMGYFFTIGSLIAFSHSNVSIKLNTLIIIEE